LFVTLFVVCGKANFTNLSRYGDYSEKTYRRHYQKSFDFMRLNAETIAEAIPSYREQVSAIDCSFIPKSGKTTWGIDSFYNGSIGKSQKGLEISVISIVDVDACQGYTLSVQQTPFTERTPVETAKPKLRKSKALASERVQAYLEHLKITRPFFPSGVKYLAADSFYSKKTVVDGVVNLELQLVSKLRIDANMRYCYAGAQKSRGARRKYDGKVDLNDLSRMEYVGEVGEELYLYSQVVWHISLNRQIRIVYLVNTSDPKKTRVALLFSTDIKLSAESIYAYYKARFQIEFIFRDAKQFTGLCDCQSRQESSLDFHFNVSLTALNIAKYDQLPTQSEDDTEPLSFSMATYKRLAFNQHLLERFISMLDFDLTLIKSHPNYQSLLQYGSLTQ
jgi:Archaeal putative transposase ISC1217